MARIDKYDPKSGGFRAPLAADTLRTDGPVGGTRPPVGVGLDVNGRTVVGEGTTGVKGVLVLTRDAKAGDVVDNMTDGEVVEFGGDAGTNYYATAAGVITDDADTGGGSPVDNTYVGHTVEGSRLIVRVAR